VDAVADDGEPIERVAVVKTLVALAQAGTT
jgi:hypothetical protein